MVEKLGQIVTYSFNSSEFNTLIRQYQASARTMKNGAKRINERAVKELSRNAQKELKRQVRRRGRQQSRNQTLVDITGDHTRNSEWNEKGFRFFVDALVRPIAPYYRAIELGSEHMKYRYIPLTFFRGGTQVNPPSVRLSEVRGAMGRPGSGYKQKNVDRAESLTKVENADSLRDYATYSGRNGTPYVVQIRREIRPYYYVRTAVQAFQSSNRYSEIVQAEVRRLAPLLSRHMR